MTQWEYRTAKLAIGFALDEHDHADQEWMDLLNTLGHQGWELVSEHYSYHPPLAGVTEATVGWQGTLKRQRAA